MSVVNFCLTVLTAGCSSSADCHHTAVFFTILLCILVFSIYNSFGCLLFDMMMMKHFRMLPAVEEGFKSFILLP